MSSTKIAQKVLFHNILKSELRVILSSLYDIDPRAFEERNKHLNLHVSVFFQSLETLDNGKPYLSSVGGDGIRY